jgi:hypothetical protein
MDKKCKNLDCGNNLKGICNKKLNVSKKTVFDKLTYSQWELVRNYSEKQIMKGIKPLKKCKNLECINNIKGGCYLPSEIEVLSIIL